MLVEGTEPIGGSAVTLMVLGEPEMVRLLTTTGGKAPTARFRAELVTPRLLMGAESVPMEPATEVRLRVELVEADGVGDAAAAEDGAGRDAGIAHVEDAGRTRLQTRRAEPLAEHDLVVGDERTTGGYIQHADDISAGVGDGALAEDDRIGIKRTGSHVEHTDHRCAAVAALTLGYHERIHHRIDRSQTQIVRGARGGGRGAHMRIISDVICGHAIDTRPAKI